jgi:heme-degrading monooxygenase HmoA
MRRRTWLSLIAVVLGATRVQAAASATKPIQLNCDLAVDPAKEKEFVAYFENVFRPVAKKHTGYIDLKLLKLNTAVRGGVPTGGRFRFSLTYQSEELRQKWIASDDHAKNWPPMENMLTDKNFGILVYDIY